MNKDIKDLENRISVLEFMLVLVCSAFLTFVVGVTKVLYISWNVSPLIYMWSSYFIIVFLSLNFIFFLNNAIEKVGTNISLLVEQWKTQNLLMKVIILLGLPSSLYGIFEICENIFTLITHLVK